MTQNTATPSNRTTSRRRALGLALAGAILVAGVAVAGLAPAAQTPPEIKEFPQRQLDLEWRGHRPDLNVDHMFRRDMPRQRSFQDAFRRPR